MVRKTSASQFAKTVGTPRGWLYLVLPVHPRPAPVFQDPPRHQSLPAFLFPDSRSSSVLPHRPNQLPSYLLPHGPIQLLFRHLGSILLVY